MLKVNITAAITGRDKVQAMEVFVTDDWVVISPGSSIWTPRKNGYDQWVVSSIQRDNITLSKVALDIGERGTIRDLWVDRDDSECFSSRASCAAFQDNKEAASNG